MAKQNNKNNTKELSESYKFLIKFSIITLMVHHCGDCEYLNREIDPEDCGKCPASKHIKKIKTITGE